MKLLTKYTASHLLLFLFFHLKSWNLALLLDHYENVMTTDCLYVFLNNEIIWSIMYFN